MTEAERRELRELVEHYAQAVDRADGDAVAALFTVDGVLALWMDPQSAEPTGERVGRAAIAEAVSGISRYDATHHTISSSSAVVDGVVATGETMCTAHHLRNQGGRRSDRVLYVRYVDEFVRTAGPWLFRRREMHVQWASVLPVES